MEAREAAMATASRRLISAEELSDKMREYLERGVRLVWIVEPAKRRVTVFRSPDDKYVLDDKATLTGDEVLPGFACKVADIF